jgi:RNA polymerase sigma-70 factor (ECF subfamily)
MDPLSELFARYRDGGDVEALGAVFDRAAPRLLRLAVHLTGSVADAEDLLQQTFVQAMRLAPQFDAARPLLPWLCALLAGQAKNLQRSRRRKAAEPLPELPTDAEPPLDAAARAEVLAALRSGIARLSHEQRQVLLLQLQHGLSPAEIADVLDVPPGAVRMRIHRGIAALRALLPTGLAVWLAALWPSRGLAAVRSEVLRHAGAAVGGTLVLKKVLVTAAALAAILAVLWSFLPPAAAPLAPPAGGAAPLAAGGAVERSDAPRELVPLRHEPPVPPPREAALRVVVQGAHGGEPIVDVPVYVWHVDAPELAGAALAQARTDAAGSVRFASLPAGSYRTGPLSNTQGVQIPSGGGDVELTVSVRAQHLAGRVVDAERRPVGGAAIELSHDVDWIGETVAVSRDLLVRTVAYSAADGTFACTVLEDESLVAARHPTGGMSPSHLSMPGIARDLVLVLAPNAVRCIGRVVDPSGRAVADALVGAAEPAPATRKLRRSDGSWRGAFLPVMARTDATGAFELSLPWQGATQVTAQRQGTLPAWKSITTPGAGPIELVLAPARAVAGVVRSAEGSPIHGCTVHVRTERNRRFDGLTDSAGRFHIDGLPIEQLRLEVIDPVRRVIPQPPLPSDARTAELTIVLPALPMLRGQVVGPHGAGLAGFTVRLDDQKLPGHSVTAADGSFELALAGDADARVLVFAPLDQQAETPIATFAVAPGDGVRLQLDAASLPRGAVRGRVVDQHGAPVGGAEVDLWPDRAESGQVHATTAADGTFTLRHLALVDAVLRVDAPVPGEPVQRRAVRRLHTAAGELGDLVLLPPAELRIACVHADGRPWNEMLPELFVDVEQRWGQLGHALDGGETVFHLLPGAVRVVVDDVGVAAEPVAVTLAAGEVRSVALPLRIVRRLTLQFAAPDEFVRGQPDEPLAVRITARDGGVVEHQVRRSRFEPGLWRLEVGLSFGVHRVDATRSDGLVYRSEITADDDPMRPVVVEVPRVR